MEALVMGAARFVGAAAAQVVAWLEAALEGALGLLGALLAQTASAYNGTTWAGSGSSGGDAVPSIAAWSRLLPVPAWAALGGVLLLWIVRPWRGAQSRGTAPGMRVPPSRWLPELMIYATGFGILYAIVRWKHLL